MSVVQELRKRYRAGKGWNVLFDVLASYTNRRSELMADTAEKATGLPPQRVRELLKELAALEVGVFLLGRHQNKTRIRWSYIPSSIGLAAQGKGDSLVTFDDDAASPEPELEEPGPRAVTDIGELLRVTKQELARQLGLRADQIEITIKH